MKRVIAVVLAGACLLAGCAPTPPISSSPAQPQFPTDERARLTSIPPALSTVDVAVYSFPDVTGQQRPNENFAEFSKAVTQGGDAVLVDVLRDVAEGRFFRVVERSSVDNLLRERQIIDQTRLAYLGQQTSSLPPLLFAGIILEGGIIDYDSNIETGGAGVRFLGVGVDTQYREDVVTVGLRAISVQNGEVLASVVTTKTVYSVLGRGSIFSYVAADEILEVEAGITRNEPVSIALRKAIELAVYSLIVEGADAGVWGFSDPELGAEMIEHYREATSSLPVI
ncbi:CsgG/HfaB family protein [Pontivivens ytuae]|uniref:Curli production assembly protein CsgG n=1 Tax=Pontivivens ytuae TaxID=2789856 RepID=A0A7S9LRC4_9RHOB|nr:CsgG/HfaB family protein [Pontivivens ytuae]QPH53881.1 curli production assembly protein CsgG [Pontivivens ytuae]